MSFPAKKADTAPHTNPKVRPDSIVGAGPSDQPTEANMRAVLQAVAATPFAEAIVNTSVVGSCGDVTATIALPLSAAAADRVALDIDGDGIFGEIECAVADLERIGAAVSTAIAAAKNAGLLRSGA